MKTFTPAEIEIKVVAFLKQNPDGVLEVLGATASGKTEYSRWLATWIKQTLKKSVEIISVDSRQIFCHTDIASAKIPPHQRHGLTYHGLDLKNPDESYNVVDFQTYAFQTIATIQQRGHIPLLCGGTMLWLDAVSENYAFSTNKNTKSTKKNPPRFPTLKIGLHWKRTKLYQRIDRRATDQFEQGLIEETKKIREKFPKLTHSAFTSFGYQEVHAYLVGTLTLTEAPALNRKRNRKYAKRQLTWWRGREEVLWLETKKFSFDSVKEKRL